MDNYLISNLNIILEKAIPNNWDGLIIITGKEGSGKTTLSTQVAIKLDPNFNINNVAWTPKQFEDIVENAKDGSSILWDEAITGANAAAWGSKVSQSVISLLTQIRKKKLKIIICFPYLNMLNKYFVSRCIASIYVYAKSFTERGNAFFYNQSQTEDLYSFMKEKYRLTPRKAYSRSSKSFFFRFSPKLCLDEEEYQKRKDEARKDNSGDEDIWKIRTNRAARVAKEQGFVAEMAKAWGVTTQYLYGLQKEN